MGYIYDKLKEALGGSKFSSSHQSVVKDWTPNNVKALFIYRDFIFVAHHTRLPKVIPLNINEFSMDIQQNGRSGALHNLLAQRQLSCMEEFYVDSSFMNYPGAMDMGAYIGKLVTERSRLRYHGYISGVNVEELRERFSRAKLNGDPLYAYATDGSRSASMSYTAVNNPMWYKNYYLRPQFYAMDAENGELYRWLTRAEGVIASKVQERSAALEEEGIRKALNMLVSQDLQVLEEVMIYLNLQAYLNKARGDKVFRCVLRGMLEGEKCFRRDIPGLRLEVLMAPITGICRDERLRGNLIRIYRRFNVFEIRGESSLELDKLLELVKSESGLLQVSDILNTVLYEIYLALSNMYSSGVLLLVIEARKYADRVPSGRFREAIGLGEGSVNSLEAVQGCIDVLLGICGWNRESFKKYISESREKNKTE